MRGCIDNIDEYTTDYEVVVIHNNYEGFAKACNQGIGIARHDFICFLNDDTMVTPNWLDKLKKCFADNSDCGIAGPTTCYSRGMQCDNKIMAKRFRWSRSDILDYAKSLKDGYSKIGIYGFCMLTKKSVLDKVGYFDERFGLGNYEEVDLILRMSYAGYHPYWVRGAYVHHFGNQTISNTTSLLKTNKRYLIEKHGNSLGSRLYYKNP